MRRPDVAMLTHCAAREGDVNPVLSASQSGTNVCAVRLLLPGPLHLLCLVGMKVRSAAQEALHAQGH
jgi:hypothetical protein